MGKDSENEILSEMLLGIKAWTGINTFRAKHLLGFTSCAMDNNYNKHPLYKFMQDLSNGKPLTSCIIGSLFKHRKRHIADGLRIEYVKADNNGNHYRIKQVR